MREKDFCGGTFNGMARFTFLKVHFLRQLQESVVLGSTCSFKYLLVRVSRKALNFRMKNSGVGHAN